MADLGSRFALHNSAPGKLLLAHLPPDQRETAMSKIQFTASTAHTLTTRTGLREACETIVTDGYACDYAEATEGIHGVAAPIFGAVGGVVGALWITGPAKRLPKARFKELGPLVAEASGRITQLIASRGSA